MIQTQWMFRLNTTCNIDTEHSLILECSTIQLERQNDHLVIQQRFKCYIIFDSYDIINIIVKLNTAFELQIQNNSFGTK